MKKGLCLNTVVAPCKDCERVPCSAREKDYCEDWKDYQRQKHKSDKNRRNATKERDLSWNTHNIY